MRIGLRDSSLHFQQQLFQLEQQQLFWLGYVGHSRCDDAQQRVGCDRKLMIRSTAMLRISRAVMICAATGAVSTFAIAAPPPTSPYVTDPQNLSVQDETAQGIGSLNMVLCVIGGVDPGALVNAGPYVALIDMNRCQNAKGGSTAASAGAASYASAVVNVTRASNSDPMIGRVWLSFTQQGTATTVYAYLSATQSPSSAPPYGAFRLDYIGVMDGNVGFNGYIDSTTPGVINYLETGQQSSNTALAMSASSTTSGSGTMFIGGNGGGGSNPVTFNFAYNPGFFHRNDGTSDECFDRALADASLAVWQYGTYSAIDGTRVDQANPGFPVLATYAGSSYYGFANYWGINFQGLAIPDGNPVSGLTVADQRQGNTTSYTMSKLGGKLTKWTQVSTTLGALDGIPFTFTTDLTGLASGNSSVTGMNNWVMQWNSSDGDFTIVGVQNCSQNGCVTSTMNPVATVDSTAFNAMPISGFANSYGGNINIPPTSSPHGAGDAVFYFNQSAVLPGSAGLTLYCLNQCPTAAQIAGYANSSLATPYANGTDTQFFSAPSSANTVSYTFGASGLLDAASAPVLFENPPSNFPEAQNGLQTGWLLDAPFTPTNCPAGGPDAQAGNLCEPPNPATYYTWQTGANQWNQSLWLTAGGNIVPFDPPQNIAYTVPTGAAYGSYSGLPLLLQFNGFGNLQGIPGTCINPTDNSVEDCNTNGATYEPAFSIPDGTAMTLPSLSGSTTTPLLVKALNGAILLNSLGSGAAQCSAMTLTPLTLPSGGLHDPSSSSDADYLGTEPTVSASPAVIDGVVQQ
jgi:hypothetical protein